MKCSKRPQASEISQTTNSSRAKSLRLKRVTESYFDEVNDDLNKEK